MAYITACSRSAGLWRRVFIVPVAFVLTFPLIANAQVIASDMDSSSSSNLISYTNPWEFAFGSLGDGFQKYQRGVSPSIPFAVVDDSLSIFPSDSVGIVKEGNTDQFFGVVDTINGDNGDPVTATWVFDITGGADLVLCPSRATRAPTTGEPSSLARTVPARVVPALSGTVRSLPGTWKTAVPTRPSAVAACSR